MLLERILWTMLVNILIAELDEIILIMLMDIDRITQEHIDKINERRREINSL